MKSSVLVVGLLLFAVQEVAAGPSGKWSLLGMKSVRPEYINGIGRDCASLKGELVNRPAPAVQAKARKTCAAAAEMYVETCVRNRGRHCSRVDARWWPDVVEFLKAVQPLSKAEAAWAGELAMDPVWMKLSALHSQAKSGRPVQNLPAAPCVNAGAALKAGRGASETTMAQAREYCGLLVSTFIETCIRADCRRGIWGEWQALETSLAAFGSLTSEEISMFEEIRRSPRLALRVQTAANDKVWAGLRDRKMGTCQAVAAWREVYGDPKPTAEGPEKDFAEFVAKKYASAKESLDREPSRLPLPQAEAHAAFLSCVGAYENAPALLARAQEKVAEVKAYIAEEEKCRKSPSCMAKRKAQEICGLLKERKERVRDIAQEKRYSRKAGVVNLVERQKLKEALQYLDDRIAGEKIDYKELSGRSFRPKACH